MSRTKKNKIVVDFSNGDASTHVTGSCIHIKSDDFSILLECGLSQSNNLRNDYLTNKEKFEFKVGELDYVFCMHAHADHSARIPLLYKRGCKAKLILPEHTSRILKDMFADSAHILERDTEQLKRIFQRDIEPLYDDGDAFNALNHAEEYPIGEMVKLDEHVSFRFVHSGHIIQGTQLELWLTTGNTTKKIIYTSDLGNELIPKYYVEPFEPLEKAHLVIAETTYGDPDRSVATPVLRRKDIEKLTTVIKERCLEHRNKILIPVFALDRLPEILTEIYLAFKDDPNFNVPVVVDTPLGLKHIESYFKILKDEKLQLLTDVFEWKHIVKVNEYSESKMWATNGAPCIILASSGMLTAGRSLIYAENMLPNPDACIVFCGYATEGSIAFKIKNAKEYKIIEVNGKKKKNKCAVVDLHSFSSHMQYPSLLNYYSDIQCEKIALVHGQMDSKVAFAKKLENEFYKKNKTSKVVIVNKSTNLTL